MENLATPTSSDASASTPVVIQPPTPLSSPSFHSALVVTNIKNFIPIILYQEDGQYWSWVELFRIHACVYHVLDHIDDSFPRPPDMNDITWRRLDVVVKQWLYGRTAATWAAEVAAVDVTGKAAAKAAGDSRPANSNNIPVIQRRELAQHVLTIRGTQFQFQNTGILGRSPGYRPAQFQQPHAHLAQAHIL